MGNKIDLTEQRFGRLIATKETNRRKGGSVVWECQCDCGNICKTTSKNLRSGGTKSCGCLVSDSTQRLNLQGRKFGKLTVVEPIDVRKERNLVWKCQCECGSAIHARGRDLKNGHIKSCGCLRVEQVAKFNIKQAIALNKEKNFVDNTNLQNLNSNIPKNNTSGVKGVSRKKNNKWIARIMFQKKSVYLGEFDKLEDAAKARKEAEEKYFHPMLEKYDRKIK